MEEIAKSLTSEQQQRELARQRLRIVVQSFRTVQQFRIALDLKLQRWLDRPAREMDAESVRELQRLYEQLGSMEQAYNERMAVYLEQLPISDWLLRQRGISTTLAGQLIAPICIYKTERPSQLWSFAGYSVVDGHAPRRVPGKKVNYNPELKRTCHNIAESFMRSGSAYTNYYYLAKEKFRKAHADWTDMHVHLAARGKMIKYFLLDFWLAWRKIEGLPVTEPYPVAYLGHANDGFLRADSVSLETPNTKEKKPRKRTVKRKKDQARSAARR